MIHHVSLPARDPTHVAEVLAELIGGRAFPFSGPLPGARMAVSGDPHGTMIEVYPDLVVMAPGEGEQQVIYTPADEACGLAPFHVLISTPRSRAAVEAIGEREGWRTRFFGRAAPGKPPAFHVIEFWVENRILLEVVTEEMAREYAAYMQPERFAALPA